jgi:hypothetical protein
MTKFIRKLLGLCIHEWKMMDSVRISDISFVAHGGEPYDTGMKIRYYCLKCEKWKVVRIR